VERLLATADGFFKDYYKPIDKEVVQAMLKSYDRNIYGKFKPVFFNEIAGKYHGDYGAYADMVFSKSFLDDKEEVIEFLQDYKPRDSKKLLKDPAFRMWREFSQMKDAEVAEPITKIGAVLDSLQRRYMKAQIEMEPARRFYPDANKTLRVSYGTVSGYSPKDAMEYGPFTTLEGIMEKENPDIYDYVVEPRLKQLYAAGNYGPYADADGSMHVAFVASNHTTGGNSGSPVLDSDGNLIGVNFDRCWEGTMSDLAFDPKVCRNISLDIRYFLFIVDKFAGASYLVDEMDIVK
jgi:hypothetical protein